MASSGRLEERVPLLTDEEEEPAEDDLSDIQVAFKQRHSAYASQARGGGAAPLRNESSGHAPSGESRRRRKHFSGNEMIVAVFVVQFDIRKGTRRLCREPWDGYASGAVPTAVIGSLRGQQAMNSW